jgi:hypothetical protein
MKHEPTCVTYDHQPKSRDDDNQEIWRMLCMDWDMDTLPLSKSPSDTTLPKSDNTYLGDDDDHQGETRQKAQI